MSDHPATTIIWFRNDLRLEDNPALVRAAESGRPVVALFITPQDPSSPFHIGEVATAWKLQNAIAMQAGLRQHYGVELHVLRGDPLGVLPRVCEAGRAEEIVASKTYLPQIETVDNEVAAWAEQAGITFSTLPGHLLVKPGTVLTGDGAIYKVFTPFHRQFLKQYHHAPPLPRPDELQGAEWDASLVDGIKVDVADEPSHPQALAAWQAGTDSAQLLLREFCEHLLAGYGDRRDLLDPVCTSRLSPYLQCGAVSPRQAWEEISSAASANSGLKEAAQSFLRQLVWREFAYTTYSEFPEMATVPYRDEFQHFNWQPDGSLLDRWKQGQTGYPVVDAAMRQLTLEGFMPGRARMVVASFLTKHLLQNWTDGERWFRELLVDADPALNAFNWQWVAGCGFDAAPYFRVFNPITQGQKFDPDGAYVRKYVPELSGLAARYIHSPWEAPELELMAAGVKLGGDYPAPVVDHKAARERALAAYYNLKR